MSESLQISLSYEEGHSGGNAAGQAGTAILFEQVFKAHFKKLHIYACTIVKDDAMAEEMVQNVFLKLWERKDQLHELGNPAGYLYRAVHNESMNHLDKSKVRESYRRYVAGNGEDHDSTDPAEIKELQLRINEVLNGLPEQCRTVFHLGRMEGLRYREIADKLGISVKTVEHHMGKALKRMREGLAGYLPVLAAVVAILKDY